MLLTLAFIFFISLNINATKKRIGVGTNGQSWNQADTAYLFATVYYQYHYNAHVGDTLLLVLEYSANAPYLNFYDFTQQNTFQPFVNSFNIPNEVKNINISSDTSLMVINGLPSSGEITFEFTNVSIQLIVHITTLATGIVESKNIFSDLTVFPNPAKDILNLNNEAKTLKVINTCGESILEEKNTKQMKVSSLRPGIYFLLINDFKKVKFIINQ